MQFLKKNYEKILLGVVVLATLGIVAFLPILVSQEKKSLDEMENVVIPPNPKPLEPLNLAREDTFLNRSKAPVVLDLSSPYKVFNPVRYQLKADGTLLWNPAGTEVDKLIVTKITPLMETYSLTSVTVTPGLATHYGIGIKHDGAATTTGRNMKTTYAEMNHTTNNFTIIAAEGPEEEPTAVKLKLTDTGEVVTLTKEKPFQRPEAYMADLVYPPESNKTFLNRRKTDTSNICFAGECYKIVDIEQSEVVLLQLSNQKQYTRPLNQTNSAASASNP
jgi:hypothetical protein